MTSRCTLLALATLGLVACGGPSAPPASADPAPGAPEPPPAEGPGGPEAPAGGPACPPGQSHFTPGCGEPPLPAAGCYQACQTDADCGGKACKPVTINPCGPAQPGEMACMACGAEAKVCL